MGIGAFGPGLGEGFAAGKLNQTMVDVMQKELEAKSCEVKLTKIEKEWC